MERNTIFRTLRDMGGRYYKVLALVVVLVAGCALLLHLCMADRASGPGPTVKGTSFTTTDTMLNEDGTAKEIHTRHGWYLFPDMSRLEGESEVTVWNGADHWSLNKKKNTYVHANRGKDYKPDYAERVSASYTPDLYRKMGASVSEQETEGALDGISCPKVEINVSVFELAKGVKVGPIHIVEYLDPNTRLVRSITTEIHEFASGRLAQRVTTKFDYTANITEDLFHFQPPKGAREAQ